jgi:hypothetical protein
MRSFRPALALALVLVATPALAQFQAGPQQPSTEAYAVELSARWWSPTPMLVIDTNALADVGGAVDFVEEFEVEEVRFRELRATLKPGRKHKLRVAYLPVLYEQTTFLVRTIDFGGQTFAVGSEATGVVDWTFWRFGYEYDVVAGPRGFVGVVVDARYNDVTASVDTADFGSAAIEEQVWVPTVGGIARGYLAEGLSATVEFSGFDLERDTVLGKLYDLDIYGTLSLGNNVGITGGWRRLQAEYQADDDLGDVEFEGIYFGLDLRF